MNEESKERFPGVTHYTEVSVQPGGINIQHVQNLYQADFLKALGVELEVKRVAEVAEADHFPLVATSDKLIELYDSLMGEQYVAEGTSKEEFLYYFGHVEYKPAELRRITWMANKSNKQLLRELIMGMYRPMTDSGQLTKACLEKIVPSVFVDNKGEPVHLSKEKKVPSVESDRIEKFLATFHN